MVELRRIGADDWALWRDVRLKALADAPEAFYSTLERERAYDEARWREWMTGARVHVVAFDNETPVGLVGGHLAEEGAELYGMWVAPAARGSGVSDDLVREVLAWAGEQGHGKLRLWVAKDNPRATRFYERLGFTMDGEIWPHPGRELHYNLMVAAVSR